MTEYVFLWGSLTSAKPSFHFFFSDCQTVVRQSYPSRAARNLPFWVTYVIPVSTEALRKWDPGTCCGPVRYFPRAPEVPCLGLAVRLVGRD